MLFMTMLGGAALTGSAQEGIDAITQTIQQFTQAGDEQQVKVLDGLLHPNFRVVWNNLEKGSITVLDRETYLGMVGDKKIGGDQRTLAVESIEVMTGGNALVRTSLKGTKADFQSMFSLVQAESGDWLLVQDQVFMQAK